MKAILIFVSLAGIVFSSARGGTVWHHIVSERAIFQKRKPSFFKSDRHIFEVDRQYPTAEIEVALVGFPFNWSEEKAQFFLDQYTNFACSQEMRSQSTFERKEVLATAFVESKAGFQEYFSKSEDQRAIAFTFTGCVKEMDPETISFTTVGIAGLEILATFEVFRSKNLFQDLDSDELYKLADNYVQNYPTVWNQVNLQGINQKSFYSEAIEEFYKPVWTESDAYWTDINLQSLELEGLSVQAESLRVLLVPESPYEHLKRTAVGDSHEAYRFYFTTGFLVIRNSSFEYCSVPVIGQSQSDNSKQMIYVGQNDQNIFDQIPEEGRLSSRLVKVEDSIESYPDIYLSIPTDLGKGCAWTTKFNSRRAISKSTYVSGDRYFEVYKLSNPLKAGGLSYALQVHQLPLFRRGLWQDCTQPEEKLWSFYSSVDSDNGFPYVGGQVIIEPDESDANAYRISRYIEGSLSQQEKVPTLALDIGYSSWPRSKRVRQVLRPVEKKEDLTALSNRESIIRDLSSR